MSKDTSVIPKGFYCYSKLEYIEGSNPPRLAVKGVCPYWSKRDDKPEQESGYCSFLEAGDWEDEGTLLLWDMVKECGENDDIDPADLEEGNPSKLITLDEAIRQEREWLANER